MNTTIWWIRRDLRLADNPALSAAVAAGDQVIPCFIMDPRLMDGPKTAQKRRDFLLGGLRSLDEDLRALGSRLILRRGDPVAELTQLYQESGATAIFAQADFSPYARRRDAQVAAALPLHLHGGPTLRHPDQVLKADGTPYTVFTPFKRAWLTQPLPTGRDLLPAPPALQTPSDMQSLMLPDPIRSSFFPAGAREAQRRLARFGGDGMARYAKDRDMLDRDATSQLSPYLRFGMISARQVMVAALAAGNAGADVWLSELIWREFYTAILYHFPQVAQSSFRAQYDAVPWQNDHRDFAAWQAGRTGYPVVDAAMRQLLATGWMHNRARMIVASFLVKDLLIDWRWGEAWFMQNLIDGDPAANNGGWQWTAGVGTDAAPYFRIFNPITQGQKFDPDGHFIRRWLPELANVPDNQIHTPWQMSVAEQEQSGCRIGRDYPAPIIDHSFARQRTLDAYAQARAPLLSA